MADKQGAEEGALKQGADAVSAAKAAIDNEIKKVSSDIAELGGYWTGESAVKFAGLMANWDEQVNKMNSVLVTLEEALSGTAQDQAATEQEHQSTIAGLGSMMGA